MISQDLLTAKGSIEALIHLSRTDTLTTAQVAAEMDVAEGTARDRLGDLAGAGLVTVDADIQDDRPVRVYATTSQGDQLANSLVSIIDDYGESASDVEAESTTDSDDTE